MKSLLPALLVALAASCSQGHAAPPAQPRAALLVRIAGSLPTGSLPAGARVTAARVRIASLAVESAGPVRTRFELPLEGAGGGLELALSNAGADLPRLELPPGRFLTLSLEIVAITLQLEDGSELEAALPNHTIPLDAALELVAGETRELLVDLGLDRSLEARTFVASPRALDLARAGVLTGFVCRAPGAGFVEGASVRVLPPGETAPGEALASAVTGFGGGFTLPGLPEGTYDVLVDAGEPRVAARGVRVAAGRATPLTLELR